MISKLSAPPTDIEEVKRALYDKLNELINAVNQLSSGGAKGTEGKAGDVRVVVAEDKTVRMEVRTNEGWYRSDDIFSRK